ncbi:secreted chloroperoxidase [Pseudovirgaria hyperparasitica]|uniref:Secreted chloroperoxidase n=1 Tax=Pseudovirgaria hyperparasitica TaxID=470096 RepID=A0A6A6W498_9PEZI|nr:secreted chloroperoxidase [Pseudovirgaria hyperparasitica]KAF2755871.1 secreted chloroperoxidase [Pseudovirgaria hyperparasitica]
MKAVFAISSLVGLSAGWAFVAEQPGVDHYLLKRQQTPAPGQPGGADTCPFNPDHKDAVPVNDKFPYNYAKNGLPGRGLGGYLVPAIGDEDHKYIAPKSTDIRGPCPGLNAAANHGFIARDGITKYTELIDAVQNAYNMGYDLANFLAAISIYIADGDLVTSKLSIGCDATTRTSVNPALTGSQPGLDGHNKFEADTSLTRNDYFLGNGDNFSFNGTLFGQMVNTTGGYFDAYGMAKVRYNRYVDSRTRNPQFSFGPLAIFTHGAASFVYEMFPSGTEDYRPTLANTAAFFGAKKERDGSWSHIPERIPDNWTTRATPYTFLDVAAQTFKLYTQYPVGFGGNVNGQFVGLDFPPYIKGGNFTGTGPSDFACLFYQLIAGPIPSSLNGIVTPTVEALAAALKAIDGPQWENLGCKIPVTK